MEPHITLTLPNSELTKVLDGRKTIISCWADEQPVYWGKVRRTHRVYLRAYTQPAAAQATVSEVLEFDDLMIAQVHNILDFYGHDDGIDEAELGRCKGRLARKKYCMLIFLENVESSQPASVPAPKKRFRSTLGRLRQRPGSVRVAA